MDINEPIDDATVVAAAPPGRRRLWPAVVATGALAVATFGLASLTGVGATAFTASPVAQSSPLAVADEVVAAAPAAPAAPAAVAAPAVADEAAAPASSGGAHAATTAGSESEDCASAEMADAFMAHVEGGHLSLTPGQQVADILAFDTWVQTHTVWFDNVLTPLLEGDETGQEMLAAFFAHVDGGHLQLTPSQQVADILEFDTWVQTHTVWIETVLAPALAQITC